MPSDFESTSQDGSGRSGSEKPEVGRSDENASVGPTTPSVGTYGPADSGDDSGDGEREYRDRYWLHAGLFVITLLSSIYAGYLFVGRVLLYEEAGATAALLDGLRYAVPLLLFLTVHEFGHYFAARYHEVKTSLPYYIPFFFPGMLTPGTLGAIIRIREPVPSLRKLFDIGVAGPLAGFVVALGALLFGFFTLPGPEYLMSVPGHEAMKAFIAETGRFPSQPLGSTGPGEVRLYVGHTPLYWALSQLFAHVPPMYEMHHYPVLFAGWLALFFTALNLLPVGQLDGGHVLYALVGPRAHRTLARAIVLVLLISGSMGFIRDVGPALAGAGWIPGLEWYLLAAILYFFLGRVFDGDRRVVAPALFSLIGFVLVADHAGPTLLQYGWTGWLIWCLLIVFLIKVEHPPVLYHEPLTPTRRVLAVAGLVIFVLCFSIRPLYIG